MSDLSPAQMAKTMLDLSNKISSGIDHMVDQTKKYAQAERDYRKAKAQAWVEVSVKEGLLAAQREADVDSATADLRFDRDIAQGMLKAAVESVRARQSQLSAYQTLVRNQTAEAEFVRTGQ